MTTTTITTAPAHAQDRRSIATTPGSAQSGTEVAAVKTTSHQNRQVRTAQGSAGTWKFTGKLYSTKYACMDAGQQYEREGFPYECRYAYFSYTEQYLYWLYIYY
ncbi:hypothetical protein GCM10009530_47640 [Microbispora corallina]|uniref:Uncharacterized protein n=1 Tax=Microbispora corallina TaxID=83302 RepID=A0ABQ4G5M4_9ACTN|nr:hypothetical protein [Microbispora corallina]GIH42339.1 hypothetical protein Mco01_53390 [Microbispora corallina]